MPRPAPNTDRPSPPVIAPTMVMNGRAVAAAEDTRIQGMEPVAAPDPHVRLGLRPPEAPGELGRLGGFRVLRILGQGGMGMVFVAEDTTLARKLAIKVIHPHHLDDLTRERFLREARAAAAIHHDHIVPIFQVGDDDGVPFMVMPLLEGETLAARLHREKSLPVRESLRIARETLMGLAAAHAAGLVHRDIKPGNLWLEGARRRVRILDFGVAHQAKAVDRLTQTGFVVGTPTYMSPEQAQGQVLDSRADLFSVGTVLYEMLLGQVPFRGEDMMTLLSGLVHQEPEPPSTVNPKVPEEVTAFCMLLLAKEPDRRPANARDAARIALNLERALARSEKAVSPQPIATVPPAPVTARMPAVVESAKPEPVAETRPIRQPRPKRRRKKGRLVSPGWYWAGGIGLAVGLFVLGVIVARKTDPDIDLPPVFPPGGLIRSGKPAAPSTLNDVPKPVTEQPAAATEPPANNPTPMPMEVPVPTPKPEPWFPPKPPKGFPPPPPKGFPPPKL